MYDFTEYAKLGYTESGSFDSSILYSTDSWTVYADTTDGDTLSLSLQFYEDSRVEMCREVYGGSGYKVYYEGLWYPAYDPTLPQSTMMFELQLKRNRSNIDVPVCIAGAASFDYDQYNDWVYMTHEDGQPLLDNAVDTMQIMHPSMG